MVRKCVLKTIEAISDHPLRLPVHTLMDLFEPEDN